MRQRRHILLVERLGGLAGFGSRGSRLRSRGTLDLDTLQEPERQKILALFSIGGTRETLKPGPDSFRYRITRRRETGIQTIEAHEAVVPPAICSCVRDEIT